jgi:cytidine deaminase
MDTGRKHPLMEPHDHDNDHDNDRSSLESAIAAARQAAYHSYSPYSTFRVGAAVLTTTGKLYAGCNIENGSYGLTVCAERVALFSAVAQGHRQIAVLVVYTPTSTATAPCGACRQVLYEFGRGARVVCVCDTDHRLETTLEALLPEAFGPHHLSPHTKQEI